MASIRTSEWNNTTITVIQKEDIHEQDILYRVCLPEMEKYIGMFDDHPENELWIYTDGTAKGTSAIISRFEEFDYEIDMVHVSVNPDAHREMQEAIKHPTDNMNFRATFPFSDCKEIWELVPNGVFVFEFGKKGVRTNYVVNGNSFLYQKPCLD